MPRLISCVVAIVFWFTIGGGADVFADAEGQADLDKATAAKMDAETVSDLSEVIRLLESALQKGLDEQDVAFAKKLLASSLVQRGSAAAAAIVGSSAQPSDWVKYRKEALADMEKAVQFDPQQSQAYFLIARLNLLPGGDVKRARAALDETIKINDDDPTIRVKALILRASLPGKPEDRLADLDEAVRLMPGDPAASHARGLMLADQGKLEAALTELDKTIALNPDNTQVYEDKAVVLARLKRFEEALTALDKARQLNPGSIAVLVREASVHTQQEKPDAALKDLNQALALDADNVWVLLLRAGIYQEKGAKDLAVADAKRALELKPNSPIAIRTYALLLAEDGKYAEATQELETLRKLDPKDMLTVLQLSALYSTQKQFDKVIEIYSAWLADEPDDWHALRGRADAYLNVGKQAEAIADYEKALQIEPQDQGILNNLAWVLATSPDEKLRNGKRALELATAACEVTEYKLAYMLSTLAAAYAETGDFDAARKWSSQAVKLGDKDHDDALEKELESYQGNKPWRELTPAQNAEAKPPAK